jgi:hypothetical protein
MFKRLHLAIMILSGKRSCTGSTSLCLKWARSDRWICLTTVALAMPARLAGASFGVRAIVDYGKGED